MKANEALRSLHSDLTYGLGTAEVENRLKRYGYNDVPEKKARPLVRFAKKFWGPTPWMLEIIIILSWTLHRYADLYIVTGLLAFNSILGFVEEQNASKAVESLKEKLHIETRVLQDENIARAIVDFARLHQVTQQISLIHPGASWPPLARPRPHPTQGAEP